MPRSYTQADVDTLKREAASSRAQAELTRDLYANLVDQYYDTPRAWRQRACWVMNQEWYDECRKIGAPSPMALRLARSVNVEYPSRYGWPEPGVTTMLGLPFIVAEDGGFPHLIAD